MLTTNLGQVRAKPAKSCFLLFWLTLAKTGFIGGRIYEEVRIHANFRVVNILSWDKTTQPYNYEGAQSIEGI